MYIKFGSRSETSECFKKCKQKANREAVTTQRLQIVVRRSTVHTGNKVDGLDPELGLQLILRLGLRLVRTIYMGEVFFFAGEGEGRRPVESSKGEGFSIGL